MNLTSALTDIERPWGSDWMPLAVLVLDPRIHHARLAVAYSL